MAWTFEQNMYGAPPIIQNFQVGADTYVGQIVMDDYSNLYGHVIPCAVASAGPDVTYSIMGLCVGVINSPTYDSTYQGDKATYDTTQAAQISNDPKGAVEVQVAIARPGDMWRAPIHKVTNGTALDTITVTTADTAGDDVVHTGTVTNPGNGATIYCRTGANRGQYRVVTTTGTADQDVTICFPYDIAVGDTFVMASGLKLGHSFIDLTTEILGIDGDTATVGSNYYDVFCHKLNLEESGKEFAVVSFSTHHLWDGR